MHASHTSTGNEEPTRRLELTETLQNHRSHSERPRYLNTHKGRTLLSLLGEYIILGLELSLKCRLSANCSPVETLHIVYPDFRKAFDTVCHQNLKEKMIELYILCA